METTIDNTKMVLEDIINIKANISILQQRLSDNEEKENHLRTSINTFETLNTEAKSNLDISYFVNTNVDKHILEFRKLALDIHSSCEKLDQEMQKLENEHNSIEHSINENTCKLSEVEKMCENNIMELTCSLKEIEKAELLEEQENQIAYKKIIDENVNLKDELNKRKVATDNINAEVVAVQRKKLEDKTTEAACYREDVEMLLQQLKATEDEIKMFSNSSDEVMAGFTEKTVEESKDAIRKIENEIVELETNILVLSKTLQDNTEYNEELKISVSTRSVENIKKKATRDKLKELLAETKGKIEDLKTSSDLELLSKTDILNGLEQRKSTETGNKVTNHKKYQDVLVKSSQLDSKIEKVVSTIKELEKQLVQAQISESELEKEKQALTEELNQSLLEETEHDKELEKQCKQLTELKKRQDEDLQNINKVLATTQQKYLIEQEDLQFKAKKVTDRVRDLTESIALSKTEIKNLKSRVKSAKTEQENLEKQIREIDEHSEGLASEITKFDTLKEEALKGKKKSFEWTKPTFTRPATPKKKYQKPDMSWLDSDHSSTEGEITMEEFKARRKASRKVPSNKKN